MPRLLHVASEGLQLVRVELKAKHRVCESASSSSPQGPVIKKNAHADVVHLCLDVPAPNAHHGVQEEWREGATQRSPRPHWRRSEDASHCHPPLLTSVEVLEDPSQPLRSAPPPQHHKRRLRRNSVRLAAHKVRFTARWSRRQPSCSWMASTVRPGSPPCRHSGIHEQNQGLSCASISQAPSGHAICVKAKGRRPPDLLPAQRQLAPLDDGGPQPRHLADVPPPTRQSSRQVPPPCALPYEPAASRGDRQSGCRAPQSEKQAPSCPTRSHASGPCRSRPPRPKAGPGPQALGRSAFARALAQLLHLARLVGNLSCDPPGHGPDVVLDVVLPSPNARITGALRLILRLAVEV